MLEAGISYLKKSLLKDSSNLNAETDLGYAFFLDHQYDSAEVHNKIALKLSPNDLSLLQNICCIEFVKKNYRATLAVSLKIISIDSTAELSYSNVADSYYNLGKYDSCILFLRRAIALHPGNGKLYGNLAFAYKETGEVDSAKKYAAIFKSTEGVVINL